MDLKIRTVQARDLFDVLTIAKESFTVSWSFNSFKNEFLNERSIFKVAEYDGKVVGYAVVRKLIDEAELLSIAVKKELRKMGIAQALLNEIFEELKKASIKSCFLEVRESNAEAIQLYKKVGFKKINVRKNYYSYPQEDAIIMKLELI